MPVEVRPCPPERRSDWARAVEGAFGEEVTDEAYRWYEPLQEPERVDAVFDGERIVGGASSSAFRFTVPGGELSASAITAVGVLPTHRRRGLMRSLMRRQLDDAHERGEPLSALWASEGSIYQRFGYGPGTFSARIDVETSRTSFLRPFEAEGGLSLIDRSEAARRFPPVYERIRSERAGLFARSETWWERTVLADEKWQREGSGPLFCAVHEVGGDDEGYATYRVRQGWEASGSTAVIEVGELVAATPRSHRALWRFLFDVDLIRAVKASRLAIDDPVLFLVEEPRRLGMALSDALWLRLVDVAASLGARSYAADGELVVELADDFCPWNAGRWRLTVDGGRAACHKAERADPELLLAADDLAAAYLGAVSFRRLAAALRIEECRDGALGRADAMFAVERAPWCPQEF